MRLSRKVKPMWEGKVSCSGLDEFCPRFEALRLRYDITHDDVSDFESKWRMGFGSAVHELIQTDVLGGNGILGKWECKVCKNVFGTNDEPIEGPECDCWERTPRCYSPYDAARYVELDLEGPYTRGHCDGPMDDLSFIEIKTTADHLMERVIRDEKPLPWHEFQPAGYFDLLKDKGYIACRMIYVNRDKMSIRSKDNALFSQQVEDIDSSVLFEVVIPYNDKHRQSSERNIERVRRFYDYREALRELPEDEYGKVEVPVGIVDNPKKCKKAAKGRWYSCSLAELCGAR